MRRGWPFIFLLLFLLFGAAGLSLVTAPPVAAQMQPTPSSDRLAPWPTVYPPTQADTGAQEYYQRCMVCHGDRGQGLTEEWRGALDPADQNCWQSGCHSQHHPPGGFVFPKAVPPVVGKGTLDQFGTAQNLFLYIKTKMPYQAPGSLSDQIYWELTAYLLRSNGFYSGSPPLDADTAASLLLVEQQPKPGMDLASRWPVWGLFGLAGLALAGWILIRWRRPGRRR
jgi:mono/diheme cytochrome c family protein